MAKAGSIKKVTIDGPSYNVAADANASNTPRVMTESVVHSGGNDRKDTLQHGGVESVTLILSEIEHQTLRTLQDTGRDDIPMSYTRAGGSVYSGKGWFNLDNYESEENRCDLTMYSKTGQFDLFSA